MRNRNSIGRWLIMSVALVCLLAGPAMAENPWGEKPDPNYGGDGGGNGKPEFDDTPWVEEPPGPGDGEGGEGNGEGGGKPDVGGCALIGPQTGVLNSAVDGPDSGLSLVDWMMLMFRAAGH